MSEINISYETLFELLRREKNRDELQKLDETFFKDLVKYLKDKEEFLEQQRSKQGLFAGEEKEKAEKQIENIKKILKEFYEKREKKIINMAMDAAKTGSMGIDTSAMLKEEKMYYDNLLGLFKSFRNGILLNMQNARMPEIEKFGLDIEEKAEKADEPEQEVKTGELKELKFTHAVPKFMGSDLEEYGPFEEGDKEELPKDVANVLINKGRAEES